MLSLDALANWETAVLASIRGATGTVDEKDAQITRSGMYAEYPAILGAYVELIDVSGDPRIEIEALKRAVFLVWYSFTQLPVDSGITELAESSVRHVFDLLESELRAHRIDDEMRWMLTWYRGVFGYVFDHFGVGRWIDEATVGNTADEARQRLTASSHFSGRGQLGDYWRSVVAP